ncbi:MAG TPA: flavodoxin-dependent (E)-4-hydroxy-3-methylbut-2-enyl-diphosphate synthase [Dehalococcoidia bacterium]|nr:flavodoxin-dependent (E)-4-hydroxy-3-methylbut-2-enyl-diphosphate synthase [Dehalococcoidia bacterium]
MIRRRMSRPISIGDVTVGGGAPVVVQSMAKTDTRDARATIKQIRRLEEFGCQIVRLAVPDGEAAASIPTIKHLISIPLIADIHFDHRLALLALEGGVDGLRLNPGNISDPEQIKEVVLAAKERNVPIRIGVNAGSLPPAENKEQTIVERMVGSALEQIKLLESLNFELIKVSLKAFDVPDTVAANQALAERMPYPIHLGITEAGTTRGGVIRSAAGIGILLHHGIGDTIRVSLTGDPCEEVSAGYEILKALDLSQRGPTLISCPSCGRTEVDIIGLANAVEDRLSKLKKSIKVAVMGCVVNGPGEARDADVGIACGKGRGVIFRNGKQVCTVDEADFLSALMAEVDRV